MPTRTDLQVRVLDLLGVTQVGQDPSAEDVQKVDSFIGDTVGELLQRRIVDLGAGDIDQRYFEPFATIVANRVGPSFGTPRDDAVEAREERRLLDLQTKFSRRRAMMA